MAKILHYIIIGCPEGAAKPGLLIGDVVKGMGIVVPKTTYKFRGEWRWDFDCPDDRWKLHRSEIVSRLRSMLHKKLIGYAGVGTDVRKEVA